MSRLDENPFKTTVRQRIIPRGFTPVEWSVSYSGLTNRTPIFNSSQAAELCDAQITASEGHPFWSLVKDQTGLKPDLGGNFLTTRWKPIVPETNYSSSYEDNQGRLWQSRGNFIPSARTTYGVAAQPWGYIWRGTDIGKMAAYYPGVFNTDAELLALGTSAIAKTRPDVSPTSVTQFLVELKRDGLPFLKTLSKDNLQRIVREAEKKGSSKAGLIQDGAGAFLENTFGLQPFVSDLRSFVSQATGGVSTLDNLIANSGKLIRRRYRFPDVNISSVRSRPSSPAPYGFAREALGGGYFTAYSAGDADYSSEQTINTVQKTWFSGAYRIYMPKDMEPVSRLRSVVDHLRWDYGLDLDFATIWNLAPWSWLLDWHYNLGDVITNMSKWSDDAVVLHYGYIMQESKTTYMVAPKAEFRIAAPSTILPSMGILVHRKRRLRATPYGFGKTFGSLTANQKAILAAIGITRL
jgi:hypothetical protein